MNPLTQTPTKMAHLAGGADAGRSPAGELYHPTGTPYKQEYKKQMHSVVAPPLLMQQQQQR
eukprot:CAMPEP_0173405626 /NCGR_PEP_ID=MMETSP1356-20130122/62308_1 /TAXON_ID=77927 ORGANISM="Hemiselmis virescens, Strain PCC157" /NCGR_SAMPLE_ID=MMETSP1356 /ASSEMBLY_ACC=CAM_ASM_000847 /LENGTH=60 /DNA_ID=CAMNT_0014366455 /DNA_START=266 /DNA_END=445 /DNA_ORIENTATION=+